MPNSFASDNVSSACPEVMDALNAVNSGIAVSYGDDDNTRNLNALFSELFEKDVTVFPVISGTASNALALAALTPSYGKVFCHAMSHINTDECAAPEFFTGGAKLIPIDSDDGKIRPESLDAVMRGSGNVHSAQPSALSITQSCETGTAYQLDEIAAICDRAHTHGLNVHMDGARFSNAIVSIDASPADMTWRAGVDVLSFGGTKNGCLAAEAVVFFNADLIRAFPFLHKRSGHLLSKMRFVSAQLEAYIQNDVWRRNARHANAMAARLSAGIAGIDGFELAYEVQSNEVFVHIPQGAIDYLNIEGFPVTEGELDETAPPRFVTAWNTTEEEVDLFLATARKAAEHC
ncbi:MAG: low specificity L-threonine aldolase [Pseudomonadota bacterium]